MARPYSSSAHPAHLDPQCQKNWLPVEQRYWALLAQMNPPEEFLKQFR